MRQDQFLRVGVIALGLLGAFHGIAFADASPSPGDTSLRIPEPGTLTLLASGIAAVGGISWLRRRKK
jgi:hypothetical protein